MAAALSALAVLACACGAPTTAPVAPTAAGTPPPSAVGPTTVPVVADVCVLGPAGNGPDAEATARTVGALAAAGFTVRSAQVRAGREVGPVAERMLASGCALVLSVTDGFGPQLATFAVRHGELPVAGTGVRFGSRPANFAALEFDRAGAAFVAGDLAARLSERPGAIGDRADPDAPGLIEAFAAGVRHGGASATAARGVDPPRVVGGPLAARRVATRWAGRGTDVVLAVGLADAVAAGGVRVVAVGTDPVAAPLARIVDDPTVVALEVTQQVADGVFVGAPVVGTMANGAVDLVVDQTGGRAGGAVPDDVRAAVERVRADVVAGRLAVP